MLSEKRCGCKFGIADVTVAQLPPSVQQTDDSSVVVWVHAHQRYSPDEWSKCVGPNMREVRLPFPKGLQVCSTQTLVPLRCGGFLLVIHPIPPSKRAFV